MGGATRQQTILSTIAIWLMCTIDSVFPLDGETEQPMHLRRSGKKLEERIAVARRLMPILYGHYDNVTGQYELHNGSCSGNVGYEDSNSETFDTVNIAIIGASIGAGLVLITVCLTWKAFVECCTNSHRRSRHRAFVNRSNDGLKCEICLHINETPQTECVFCGTAIEESNTSQSRREETHPLTTTASRIEDIASSPSKEATYLNMFSPPVSSIRRFNTIISPDLNPRQLVARERHQWKRCITGQNVRWVSVPFQALQENKALCGTIISERDFQDWKKVHPFSEPGTSRMSISSLNHSDSSKQQFTWLNSETAFVRDVKDPSSDTAVWCLAEEFSASSRQYSKTVLRTSALSFSAKAQWFYLYSLKLSSSIVDGFHTIRVHRERVLKQSMTLFMSAPSGFLHRRLRVDFMGEAGIDGGGILREWLHLVCSQISTEALGLFALTSSSAHQGYWIKRTSTAKSAKHLEMYEFFGKVLGKALLEGLFFNMRLSIPLLKHILGVPLKLSDLYLLDETVYSSMMWILENDNTNALGLNFTIEGIELIPSGTNVTLHDGNKQLYVAKVAQYYLFESVQTEVSCIVEGLRSIISDSALHIFDFKELDLLLSGLPHIDLSDWRLHTDVQFCEQTAQEFQLVEWFWEILEALSQDQLGRLLQYVTGSSCVPSEGFKVFTKI
ncbi:uncharacterized protein CCR75_008794 [Bremia lactucae]|uniref:HECT-type E3 ubiquitin transferase n=1 Tax=Bremia lactucae TaxID=4779 RepID=A0A976IB03_BRELC|nr:hypothetical protein CCR75_008794 [Bremia lactucae]